MRRRRIAHPPRAVAGHVLRAPRALAVRLMHAPHSLGVRLLRALHSLSAAGRPARPAPPSRPDQLRALLAVLDDAVLAQTPADAAVAACGEPGPVSRRTAQRSGQQSIALHRLRTRLEDLWLTDPELLSERSRAGRLLAYDLWMLRESLNLAFTVRPTPRTEAARQRLNGLGRPADDLRRLRDALRAQLPDQ